MKNHKKFIFGLFLAVLLTTIWLVAPRRTSALAGQQEAQQCAANLKFEDIAHISCTVNGVKTVFVDNNPTDGTVEYTTQGFEGESSSTALCQQKSEYLNYDGGNFHLSDAGTTVKIRYDLFYSLQGQSGCKELQGTANVSNTGGIKNLLAGAANSASSFSDLIGGNSLSGHSFSRYGNGAYDPNTNVALLGDSVDLSKCSGSFLAIYLSGTSGSTATEYDIGTSGSALSTKTNLKNLAQNSCGVSRINYGLGDSKTVDTHVVGLSPAATGLIATKAGQKCDGSATPPAGYTCQCVHDETGGQTCTLVASSVPPDVAADTSTSCIDDKSLAWIVCPVITGLSKTADFVEAQVAGQLNFDVKTNLSPEVEKAWSIFRALTSVVLVIVMLVMVISQAAGGGPFDAYTVRKLLPKLVAAVILMQISWFLLEYMIRLSNDAGQSIGQLMAAPFGGPNALELGPLLKHWSSDGAAIVGVAASGTAGLIGALIISGTLLTWGWPILVLMIITLFIAVLVAFATLLIRNALIILLIMLAPLAFLAYVLPGTDRYWKMWKDNLIRVLVFFPLVIAFIYAGRIFAWVAGGLGSAGPFDLIMILAGFFGPYFFLPKTFKWAGPAMAQAANALNNAWPVKKGREVAGRELLAAQKRKQNELVDKYYETLTRAPDGKKLTAGMRARAALKRGVVRTAAGHAIPTKRNTRVMMQEAGKWKGEEIELAEGEQMNAYKEFQKGNPSKGIAPMSVQQAKEAVRDKYYDPTGKNALQNRAFFTWAYDTKSFMEMGNKDWRTGNGQYEDMFKTQGWIDFMHGNPQAYGDFSGRLGASSVPFRLPLGGGPKAEDFHKGGKRYNVLDQEEVLDEQTGQMVKNVFYNPGLKRLIDTGDERTVSRAAELAADSERFHKLISQSDDPSNVVSQRPEEYESLMNINAQLKAMGGDEIEIDDSAGVKSLKAFIDHEATSFSGRNTLHRLQAGSGKFVDQMMGEDHYIDHRMNENVVPGAGAIEGGPSASQPAAQTEAGQQTQNQQTVAGATSEAASYRADGTTTGGGQVYLSRPGQPTEGGIDVTHLANAIGESVREATFQGTREGMGHALREAGLHRGPGTPPETGRQQQSQNEEESNDEDENT